MRISDWSSDVCSSDLLPDQGLDRLDLAEVERQRAGLVLLPVFKQAAGDLGDPGIVRTPPLLDTFADTVDELEFLRPLGVVPGVEDLVGRRAATVNQVQRSTRPLLPVPRRRFIKRVDDHDRKSTRLNSSH